MRTLAILRRAHSSNCLFALLRRGLDSIVSTNGMIEVEIGGGHAGNEPRSTTEGQILDCPLNKNQDPTLKFDDVHQVYKSPYQPRRQPPEMHAENVGHRRRP